MPQLKMCNVPIDDVPIEWVVSQLANGSLDGKIIVTPNVDHVVRFNRDKRFSEHYLQADLFLNDSRIIRELSRFTGRKIENVVPGSDLTQRIIHDWDKFSSRFSICVIGATHKDVECIKSKYGIDSIYHYCPPFGFIDKEEEIVKCIEFCKTVPPSIFFVSVGSPRQEILSERLRGSSIKGVFLCVGASVLFLSGAERRAPKIMQKLCLEWLFRFVQSPKRLWRRYLIDGPYIFWLCAKQIMNRT